MGGAVDSSAAMDAAAQMRKATLKASSGMAGLVQNRKVFGIAMFACLGGYVISLILLIPRAGLILRRLLYGYNQVSGNIRHERFVGKADVLPSVDQGVFSGVCESLNCDIQYNMPY